MSTPKDELRVKLADLVEEHFPKGKCKERGQAMVLVAYAEILATSSQQQLIERIRKEVVQRQELIGWTKDDHQPIMQDLQYIPLEALDTVMEELK